MTEVTTLLADGVLEITMDRPARKNALSIAMYAEMTSALVRASADDAIRVVSIRGASGVFTSGNDLDDFLRSPPVGESSPVSRFLDAWTTFEKPLVAAVEGHAIGIGTTMLLHCDLVYAADTARFALPFVNLALVPEAASTFLLPRLMGHARAAELLFFGEPFDAVTARQLGLVNAVMPAGELLAETRRRTSELAAKPQGALRATKRLLKAPTATATRERMQAEGAEFVVRLRSPEVIEALSARLRGREARRG